MMFNKSMHLPFGYKKLGDFDFMSFSSQQTFPIVDAGIQGPAPWRFSQAFLFQFKLRLKWATNNVASNVNQEVVQNCTSTGRRQKPVLDTPSRPLYLTSISSIILILAGATVAEISTTVSI